MRSRVGAVTRNTLWAALDVSLDFALPVVTSILVARALGPARLGAYAYILWLSHMGLMVGSLGIPKAIATYLAQDLTRGDEATARAILSFALRVQTGGVGLVVASGMAWVFLVVPGPQQAYTALALASIFPAALMGAATAINTAREDFGANVVASIAGTVTQAAGVLLTLVFHWDLPGLAASLLVGRTVDCVLRWVLVRARLPAGSALLDFKGAQLPAEKRREVLEFCWHATLLLVINLIVWNRSEMFFLERFCDLHQVAFFSVAFAFARLPGDIAAPFSRAAVAGLYVERGRSRDGAVAFAAVMARYVSLVVFPTAVGLAAISAPLVTTLYGAQYAEAVPVLIVAGVLGAAAPLAEPAVGLTTVSGGQYLLVRWGVVSAALTLALDLWLVRWGCAMGGAVANGCGQLLSTLGVWVIARRRFGLHPGLPFLGSVALAAGLMGVLAAGGTYLLPGISALVLVPPLGALAYFVLLRHLRVLDATDRTRLEAALELVPARPRWLLLRAVSWIIVAR